MKKLYTLLLSITALFAISAGAQAQPKTSEEEIGNIVVFLNTAEWGQGSPYNGLCFTTNGKQARTGCVPTAYAILMHYHKWPLRANEKKVYHSGTGESITLGHEYDWDNMLHNYRNGYNDEQATAVATLMRDIGYAYQVAYGTGSTDSGAGGEGAGKLIEVFKYRSESPNTLSATMATSRDVLNNDALWVQYIKESLDAGCPIPYSSFTSSGGRHIFILDGYTDNGYFHFNWGWGGNGNGWFKLDEMKPDAYSDYSKSHRAYFMLKPDKGAHTISVSVNDPDAGSATINGESSATLEEGESATLAAVANDGYTFVNWTLNNNEVSCNATFEMTVTGPAEYVANFTKAGTVKKVTIKTEATAGGHANVNGAEEVTVAVGTDITLTAIADEGYEFVEWRSGTEVVAANERHITTAQNNRTYTAVFREAVAGNVTIEVKGSGGYAYIGNGTDRKTTVTRGSTVSVHAWPAEGSDRKFAYWSTGNTIASGKGTILTNKNPYEFVANEDVALYVNFVSSSTDLNVTVSADATPGGTASVNGASVQEIALGSDIEFKAKADDGYSFTGWAAGNEIVSTEPVYATIARGEMTLTAIFMANGTGIEETATDSRREVIHDISGRRVERATRTGIYIVNGEKTFRK